MTITHFLTATQLLSMQRKSLSMTTRASLPSTLNRTSQHWERRERRIREEEGQLEGANLEGDLEMTPKPTMEMVILPSSQHLCHQLRQEHQTTTTARRDCHPLFSLGINLRTALGKERKRREGRRLCESDPNHGCNIHHLLYSSLNLCF